MVPGDGPGFPHGATSAVTVRTGSGLRAGPDAVVAFSPSPPGGGTSAGVHGSTPQGADTAGEAGLGRASAASIGAHPSPQLRGSSTTAPSRCEEGALPCCWPSGAGAGTSPLCISPRWEQALISPPLRSLHPGRSCGFCDRFSFPEYVQIRAGCGRGGAVRPSAGIPQRALTVMRRLFMSSDRRPIGQIAQVPLGFGRVAYHMTRCQ